MTRKPVKLVIQIPCLNEEKTLPIALAALPRQVPGIDTIEVIIIDDGSTDRTVEVARSLGVAEVVSMGGNRGLARGFMAGIQAALARGADIIVNTDADNQYDASCIPALIAPVLQNQADIVIGARPIGSIEHFSPIKKALQRFGSAIVRVASRTRVEDAPSGFRAFSRDAARRLMVLSDYTYTLETIIHAGHDRLRVVNVPVGVNGVLRPSRLMKSIRSYVQRSMGTILRFALAYRAARLFWTSGAVALLGAVFAVIFRICGGGLDASLAALGLGLAGVIFLVGGTLADQMILNRRLQQDIRLRLHALEEGKTP